MLSEVCDRVDEQDSIPVQRCNEVLVNQTAKSNDRMLDLCTSPTRGRGSGRLRSSPLSLIFVVEMSYDEKPIAQHALGLHPCWTRQLNRPSRGI